MKSTLTQEDVDNLLKKYNLSSFSGLAAGNVLAINPPPKHIVVYEHTLENGFELLCFYHEIPSNPRHFLQLFKLNSARGRFYFDPMPGSPRIYCDLLKPYQDCNDKFFFLKYDMGTYPEMPLNKKFLEEYQLFPHVHATFQVSRVMYLSKGWDNCLVRDYLMLAKESIFSDYTWPSESDRVWALIQWRKDFEQRSRSRKKDEIVAAKVVEKAMGESVGQTNAQEASSTNGEGELAEFSQELDNRKRCLSKDTLQETTQEPVSRRAKIHSCSNISNHDVEGHNVELDGVLAQMPSGGVAGTPITAAAGEGPPENMTLLAADMGKITSRFLSSAMGYEEKLAKLKDALDKKTAECQAWEEKFNKSQMERVLAVSKLKEYEKLLEDQKSEFKLLKEQNEALDAAVNNLKVSFLNGLSNVEKAKSLQRK